DPHQQPGEIRTFRKSAGAFDGSEPYGLLRFTRKGCRDGEPTGVRSCLGDAAKAGSHALVRRCFHAPGDHVPGHVPVHLHHEAPEAWWRSGYGALTAATNSTRRSPK